MTNLEKQKLLIEIARQLSFSDEPRVDADDEGYGRCAICQHRGYRGEHEPDCAWLMAGKLRRKS